MLFTAVKGTAGVYGEQQQKFTQSCVFVCDNPESQVCFQKIEEAAINKYSCNFPAAQGASFFCTEDGFLFTLAYSRPAPPPPEAYVLYFYVFSIRVA